MGDSLTYFYKSFTEKFDYCLKLNVLMSPS